MFAAAATRAWRAARRGRALSSADGRTEAGLPHVAGRAIRTRFASVALASPATRVAAAVVGDRGGGPLPAKVRHGQAVKVEDKWRLEYAFASAGETRELIHVVETDNARCGLLLQALRPSSL